MAFCFEYARGEKKPRWVKIFTPYVSTPPPALAQSLPASPREQPQRLGAGGAAGAGGRQEEHAALGAVGWAGSQGSGCQGLL